MWQSNQSLSAQLLNNTFYKLQSHFTLPYWLVLKHTYYEALLETANAFYSSRYVISSYLYASVSVRQFYSEQVTKLNTSSHARECESTDRNRMDTEEYRRCEQVRANTDDRSSWGDTIEAQEDSTSETSPVGVATKIAHKYRRMPVAYLGFSLGGCSASGFYIIAQHKPKMLPLRFPCAPGSASGCSFIDVWRGRESGDMFCESISVFKEIF